MPVGVPQVPGEFGNDTLCTDPGWHRALLALKWLGIPFDVRHKEVGDAIQYSDDVISSV